MSNELVDTDMQKRLNEAEQKLGESRGNIEGLKCYIEDLEAQLNATHGEHPAVAAAKVHSERARNAVREHEATRSELVLANRQIVALQKASNDKDAIIEDLNTRLKVHEEAFVELKEEVVQNANIRRSQRTR